MPSERIDRFSGCENVLEIIKKCVCFLFICMECVVIMDEKIWSFIVLAYECIKSFPVFGCMTSICEFVAHFDPLPRL